MDNVFGPFDKLKFAGATVRNVNVTQSWGDQSSYVNMIVVEDPVDNDYFLLQEGEMSYDNGGSIGTPYQITYGGFTYGGLLKSVERVTDIDSYPTYKVTLVSPVEVLDAAQVILAGYVGPNSDIIYGGATQKTNSFAVSNLLNVYGWAEGGGANFGRSLTTDIGMPWTGTYGIQSALQTLLNTADAGPTSSNYGSYIRYKGNLYTVDVITNIPTPPSFYRLGGAVNMTLLEVMTRFFEDAGVQWMIKLKVNPNGPHVISFVTVPRYVQQPLGQIANYINGQSNVNQNTRGQELRSDITQAFLVGGALNLIQPIQNSLTNLNVIPFFGFDFQGNPITGSTPGGTQFTDDNLQFNLNATQVADIMGELGYGLSYACSILELRCALGNYDTWAAYIQLNKPSLAQQLRLFGAWDLTNAPEASTLLELMNVDVNYVNSLSMMFQDNHWPAVCQRLYEFVRSQAEVYYGKKFLVILPFSEEIYLDPFTDTIQLSNELCDAGYAPEGEQLLNLNFVNENFFMDQTGRFYPFVQYLFYSQFNAIGGQKILTPNVAYLKGTSTVVQYNNNPQFSYVFSRCEQGDEAPVTQNGQMAGGGPIFFTQNQAGFAVPAMIISVPDAIWAQAEDITGSLVDLSYLMNVPIEQLQDIAALRNDSFNLQIHPPAFYPTAVAVALKSNQEVYGPWGKYTTDGKLNFEQDEGLVPWEYGDYNTLNLAAIAKLNNIAMGNQVLERGSVTEAGLPKAAPGEYLVEEGPILTSVSFDISTGGVTTSYSMETFVNRIGAFTLENAERLRRIGKIYQQLRRSMRQLIITQIERASIMNSNYKGFMYGTSYAVEQHTPHGAMGGRLILNNSGTYSPMAWSQTHKESLSNLGMNSDVNFQSTACVGMEALFRPYTTNKLSDYLAIVPGVDTTVDTSNLIIGDTGTYTINPLQNGCDIQWLLTGDTYTSMKTSNPSVDYTDARSMALRGPVMINAWGYDIQGNPVPNSGALVESQDSGIFTIDFQTPLINCNTHFMDNYLQLSNQWPAAPLDIVYDKFRSVWASPGMILEGTYSGVQGGQNYMTLYINNKPTNEILQFSQFLTGSIPTGVKMQCGWNPLKRAWTPISVDCSS